MTKMLPNPLWAAVCKKADLWGETIGQYLIKARHNFVVVQPTGDAIHWSESVYDYVVFGDKDEAKAERDTELSESIMTEYDYLVSKGFDWAVYESQGLI